MNHKSNNNSNKNGTDDIFGLSDLGAAPLALQGSSKSGGMWKGSTHAAPTMTDTFGLSDVSAPTTMMGKHQNAAPQQTMIQQQAVIMPSSMAFGFGDVSTKPQLEILPNVGEDFSEFAMPRALFIASKCAGVGLTATPAAVMYQEKTSVVVDETPQQVLSKLKLILSEFSNDIDYSIDQDNYTIRGQIFIRHFAVYFRISIWRENANATRVEFRRSDGDSFAFEEFWHDVERTVHAQFTNVQPPLSAPNNEQGQGQEEEEEENDNSVAALGSLPPMDYSLMSFDASALGGDDDDSLAAMPVTKDDLDNVILDIRESDPSVVYSIAMVLDAFKVQAQFVAMVLNHVQFVRCIIDSALTHQDTALVRGALITLEKLCDSRTSADMLLELSVLDSVVPLLGAHCELIRKYAVRVLAKLSVAPRWKFSSDKLRRYAELSVRQCRDKWENCRFATNDFIQTQMFENINTKLVGVN